MSPGWQPKHRRDERVLSELSRGFQILKMNICKTTRWWPIAHRKRTKRNKGSSQKSGNSCHLPFRNKKINIAIIQVMFPSQTRPHRTGLPGHVGGGRSVIMLLLMLASGRKSLGPINQPPWPTLSRNWVSMLMLMSIFFVSHLVYLHVSHHVGHHNVLTLCEV